MELGSLKGIEIPINTREFNSLSYGGDSYNEVFRSNTGFGWDAVEFG